MFTRGGVPVEDPKLWGLSGWVCYDGNCTVNEHPGLRRAAWAAAELSDKGDITAAACGPALGELAADAAGGGLRRQGRRGAARQRSRVDCKNVFRDDEDPLDADDAPEFAQDFVGGEEP